MNQKQIEAYRYYQEQYPGTLVMFHLPGHYEVIFNDNNSESFPDTDIHRFSELGETHAIHVVEYRNASGELDYPDIELLKHEKEIDY